MKMFVIILSFMCQNLMPEILLFYEYKHGVVNIALIVNGP